MGRLFRSGALPQGLPCANGLMLLVRPCNKHIISYVSFWLSHCNACFLQNLLYEVGCIKHCPYSDVSCLYIKYALMQHVAVGQPESTYRKRSYAWNDGCKSVTFQQYSVRAQ